VKNMSQYHFVHQKFHMELALVVTGWWLTAWAMEHLVAWEEGITAEIVKNVLYGAQKSLQVDHRGINWSYFRHLLWCCAVWVKPECGDMCSWKRG
jgi:hypothetical protein